MPRFFCSNAEDLWSEDLRSSTGGLYSATDDPYWRDLDLPSSFETYASTLLEKGNQRRQPKQCIYLDIYVYTYMYIYLFFTYLFTYSSIYLFVFLFIYLFIHFYQFICLFIYLLTFDVYNYTLLFICCKMQHAKRNPKLSLRRNLAMLNLKNKAADKHQC